MTTTPQESGDNPDLTQDPEEPNPPSPTERGEGDDDATGATSPE